MARGTEHPVAGAKLLRELRELDLELRKKNRDGRGLPVVASDLVASGTFICGADPLTPLATPRVLCHPGEEELVRALLAG